MSNRDTQGRCIQRCCRFNLQAVIEVLSLQQRQRSDINMSSSNWRDGENRELPTIMGEEVMQPHLTKTFNHLIRDCSLQMFDQSAHLFPLPIYLACQPHLCPSRGDFMTRSGPSGLSLSLSLSLCISVSLYPPLTLSLSRPCFT